MSDLKPCQKDKTYFNSKSTKRSLLRSLAPSPLLAALYVLVASGMTIPENAWAQATTDGPTDAMVSGSPTLTNLPDTVNKIAPYIVMIQTPIDESYIQRQKDFPLSPLFDALFNGEIGGKFDEDGFNFFLEHGPEDSMHEAGSKFIRRQIEALNSSRFENDARGKRGKDFEDREPHGQADPMVVEGEISIEFPLNVRGQGSGQFYDIREMHGGPSGFSGEVIVDVMNPPASPQVIFSASHNAPNIGEGGYAAGVVIREDGYILTTSSLIGAEEEFKVRFQNGETALAKLVGIDRKSELAVLKVEKSGLKPAPFASSSPSLGEWLVAPASDYEGNLKIELGMVSGGHMGNDMKSTSMSDHFNITNMSRGQSLTGILFNLRGELTASVLAAEGMLHPFSNESSVQTAYQIDTISDQLISNGFVPRGMLGVNISDLSKLKAQAVGLNPEQGGVFVNSVIPNSSAQKAGIAAGDVITEFDDKPVQNSKEFSALIASLNPGSVHEVTINRQGKPLRLSSTLDQRADKMDTNFTQKKAGRGKIDMPLEVAGLLVIGTEAPGGRDNSRFAARIIEVTPDVDSDTPFRRGDVITQINGKSFADLEEMSSLIEKSKELNMGSVIAEVQRRFATLYVGWRVQQ